MADGIGLKFEELSATFQKQIKGIRSKVVTAGKTLWEARKKVKDIAPEVIGLLKDMSAEHKTMTMIEFVRFIDPTVPASAQDRDGETGYRNHPTYAAVRYMQQVMTQKPRGKQGSRDSALDQLARSLATVLQIPGIADKVWAAVVNEFHLEERSLDRLKKRVANTRPIVDLSEAVKPVHIDRAKVIHMEPKAARTAVNAAGVAGGQGGERPASAVLRNIRGANARSLKRSGAHVRIPAQRQQQQAAG